MKYELLLLDADDTLFDYRKGESYALQKTFEQFGITVDFNNALEVYKLANKKVWKDFEQNKISAEKLKTERFENLFAELGIDRDTQKFSDAYLDHLSFANFLLDGTEEVIKNLYGKIRMAIITNGLKQVQRPRFDRSAIGPFMNEYIISEEIGMQKPDEAIFEYTFEKLNHGNKETCLIVGDNLTSDILGGIRFGIDTCWFNPKGGINTSGLKPDYEISGLKQLLDILG